MSICGSAWRGVLAAVLAGLPLAGCFEARSDLIGNHALSPVRLESLVTFNGYPYRLDRTPDGILACELRRKDDGPAQCAERYRIVFERSRRGNLIVQATAVDARLMDEGASTFLLISHDPAREDGCFFMLGQSSDRTTAPVRKAEQAIAERFGDGPIDRGKLLAIVDEYERSVLPLAEECPGNALVVVSPPDMRFADEPVAADPVP